MPHLKNGRHNIDMKCLITKTYKITSRSNAHKSWNTLYIPYIQGRYSVSNFPVSSTSIDVSLTDVDSLSVCQLIVHWSKRRGPSPCVHDSDDRDALLPAWRCTTPHFQFVTWAQVTGCSWSWGAENWHTLWSCWLLNDTHMALLLRWDGEVGN